MSETLDDDYVGFLAWDENCIALDTKDERVDVADFSSIM